jgi:Flp pilus assembly pilin Flp
MADTGGFFSDDSGQDLTEYALLATLISLSIVGALLSIGGGLAATYQSFIAPIAAATSS